MSSLYLIFTVYVQTVSISTSNVRRVTHHYNPCPDRTQSLQPISSLYPSLPFISRQPTICKANVQSVPHFYSPCPDMHVQYPNFNPCLTSTHRYSPCSESTPSLQHNSRQNPISTAPLLPMTSQYTISPVFI